MKLISICALFFILAGCSDSPSSSKSIAAKDNVSAQRKTVGSNAAQNDHKTVANAETIMNRKQVPVLCYHHIRDLQMISKASKGYEVTVNEFKAQMKILSDSGYHTITPDQLYNYLAFGEALPKNPVMITFDDTDEEQFTIGKPEMDKYGFKGVYFIMTISIGRPRYMSKEQIKQLSDEGHAIECHTWDHHMVTKYSGEDWNNQLDKPRKKLEEITGKKIDYFAYPFGLWNEAAIPELKKREYRLAFQLSTKRDPQEPLFTVRRMIVSPEWSAGGVLKVMRNTFH